MKPQIAAGSKGVPTAYGEILFRAWKETVGGAKSNETDTTEVSNQLLHLTILSFNFIVRNS